MKIFQDRIKARNIYKLRYDTYKESNKNILGIILADIVPKRFEGTTH